MAVREGVGDPTENRVYCSPAIEGVDGASIVVEESPDNCDLTPPQKQYIISIRRDGKTATVRLDDGAVRGLVLALQEAFSPVLLSNIRRRS